jgi:phosphatidylinositol dimannoside acyltransferase
MRGTSSDKGGYGCYRQPMAETIRQQEQAGALGRLVTRVSPGVKFRGFKILSRIAGVTPLRVSYAIAVVVGDFIYYTWRDHSGNAVSNMRRVLGPAASERDARRVAQASFRNYAKTLADFIRFPHVTTEEIERRIVHPYGLDVMDAALARGKGVLALSGHIGNWDFAGAVMGARDTPMYALADSFEPPELDELVVQTRLRNGVRIIKMEPTAMRTIFEALRRNEVVLMLIDRPMPGEGVPVHFFGETAWLPSGPAAIALKTGATVVIGCCIRRPGDREFTGGIEPPLDYQKLISGNKQADTQAITQAIATALERLISRAPDQWYMFRPMWPRPMTESEARQARRAERRRIRRVFRRRRMRVARQSISRLRARLRSAGAAEDLSGVALGISVDPPEMEHWVGGKGPQEP